MIKNIKEVVALPASFLVEGIKTLPEDVIKKMIELAKHVEDGAVDKTMEDEVEASFSEKFRSDLKALGVRMPYDRIELRMSLGEMLYSIYASNVKPTGAPLAIKRHEKRLLDLSGILVGDEFEMPSDLLSVIEDVLNSEEKWNATQFGATVVVEGKEKHIGLSAAGAALFRNVLNEAINLCMEKANA